MLFVKPRFRFRIDDLYVILVFALNLCHNAAAAMSQVRARSWLRTCLMTVIVCGAMTSYVAAMPPPLCLAPLPATCQQQCNETVTISNETDVLATFSFLPNRMLSCTAYIAFVVSDNQVYWTVLQKSRDPCTYTCTLVLLCTMNFPSTEYVHGLLAVWYLQTFPDNHKGNFNFPYFDQSKMQLCKNISVIFVRMFLVTPAKIS